jgi:NAD(P)H dehydrogenase (quinone)
MKVLVVIAHQRRPSLTGCVADIFDEELRAAGHAVELADLVAEGFDPVLREPDEPDWADADKIYSPAVRAEMARIARNDAIVMVFPVWWWSVPAVLKGWIDRVWNNGWAYGDRKIPVKRAWMVGIAGATAEAFAKRGYDEAMRVQLKVGLLDYCGVADSRLDVLYGSLEGDAEIARILEDARALARSF